MKRMKFAITFAIGLLSAVCAFAQGKPSEYTDADLVWKEDFIWKEIKF